MVDMSPAMALIWPYFEGALQREPTSMTRIWKIELGTGNSGLPVDCPDELGTDFLEGI